MRRRGRRRRLQLAADCYSEVADLQVVLRCEENIRGLYVAVVYSFPVNETHSLQNLIRDTSALNCPAAASDPSVCLRATRPPETPLRSLFGSSSRRGLSQRIE